MAKTFTLTEEHLKLLENAFIVWENDRERGARWRLVPETIAAFDDDALVKMLLAQFADGFPDFASGGERMRAAADRAREIIRTAWDTRETLTAYQRCRVCGARVPDLPICDDCRG